MNEFEALKRIETTFSLNKEGKASVYREYTNSIYPYYEDFNLVLNALNELKAIKEAKPSGTLEYGKWYPISVYYKNKDKLDWALVQFKDTKTGFMPLPFIAEYIKRDRVWTTHSDKDRYLCELYEPVAFMLWQPYVEVKDND